VSTTLEIVRIPVLSDNHVWLMREPQSGSVGVVDPAVAGPVLAEADKRRWKITHILNTHHHGDHVGGNREIKAASGCTSVGPRRDRARLPGIDVERADMPSVQNAVGMSGADPIQVFAEVRHRKDVFR
jgi:hydroxyacylglutathione hydrolase